MNNEEKNLVTPVDDTQNNQDVVPVTTEVKIEENADINNQVVVTPTDNNNQVVVEPVVPTTNIEEQVVTQQPVVEEKQENNSGNDNKGPSTFAKIMTFLLFGFFFALVYYLPEVTDYITLQQSLRNQAEIVNGKLICTNTKDSDTLDIKIEATFEFTDKQISKLTHITTSIGDKYQDKDELNLLRNECSQLKNETSEYEGIQIICSNKNGINETKQILNYEMIKTEELKSSYAEAGGIYIDFAYRDKIDKVKSKMETSGYKCEKVSF